MIFYISLAFYWYFVYNIANEKILEDLQMKKTVAILIFIIFFLMFLLGCNQTANEKANPASDFEYEINSDQTGIHINKYIGTAEHVVIPSEINGLPVLTLKGILSKSYPTIIDEGVFEGTSVKTVVVPETINTIGDSAFYGCTELSEITILPSSNLTYIAGNAFANCINLEKIDLSSTQVKWIDILAFRGCSNLKEIKFSQTLEEIREKAFYECSSLREIVFSPNLTQIKGGAFAYCTSLKRIVIPAKLNLSSVDEAVFHNVPSLKLIVFEEGRDQIAGYAFLQTDASVEIIVPKSVKSFSPLTFLINPSTPITVTFLGDAPKIEDEDADWFGEPTIYYDPTTNGWEYFAWNEKFNVKPIQIN